MTNYEYVIEMACLLLMYPTEKCVEWEYYIQKNAGYGLTRHGKKTRILVHRISLEAKLGRTLDSKTEYALHSCDNRKCFSPNHLFLGNAQTNYQDMVAKKRGANRSATSQGSNNPRSKLSYEQVQEILSLWRTGNYSQKELGAKFNVSGASISYLVKFNGWKNGVKL